MLRILQFIYQQNREKTKEKVIGKLCKNNSQMGKCRGQPICYPGGGLAKERRYVSLRTNAAAPRRARTWNGPSLLALNWNSRKID
jgi:hypothetical protein